MLTEDTKKKWAPVIDFKGLPEVKDPHRREVTAALLENQNEFLKKKRNGGFLAEAAPANASGTFPNATNLKGYDPILISMVRRAVPKLIAFDVCGVQPMNGPTGLIFALKSRYTSQGGTEALFNEADTTFSGTGTQTGTVPVPQANSAAYTYGTALTTANGEALGTSGSPAWPEMAISIDKVTVTAGTRALKAEYTEELAEDLANIHGLNAQAELANILAPEILFEINRELIRTIYAIAVTGAQNCSTPGIFDLDIDANGRWMQERFIGLFYQIEREANAIAKSTRRGRANVILASSDVVSALAMAGQLNSSPALAGGLQTDETSDTFAGVLAGKYKVFIDPYVPQSSINYFVAGYKGENPVDAGLFYCPYVPLQMVSAVDPNSFQPKIGFKTRYGVVVNPFSNAAGTSNGVPTWNSNVYYRRVEVDHLG